MFCPKCATQAVEGQRYCRNCGISLGVILDAMENKRQPLDFDALKKDLQQLGRKHRRRHPGFDWVVPPTQEAITEAASCATTSAVAPATPPVIKVKTGKQANSRRYSLQRAMLSILGGGGSSVALYYLLNTAANSGLLASIERILVNEVFHRPDIVGIAPVLQMLWILGLAGVAKGFAHLLNGIFFAPRPNENEQTFILNQSFNATGNAAGGERMLDQPAPQAAASFSRAQAEPVGVKPTPTNELDEQWKASFRPSVTEDETVRLGARERQTK
jgi:hypothetical protein